MSYSLYWASPALPFIQKQNPIAVPAGSVVSNAASLRFTGKGAANYGKIQQENMMRLLENFAAPTAPSFPTVGQTWYDTTNVVLKVCISTAPFPVIWQQLNSTQITDVGQPPPTPVVLGDTWFSRTGTASGVLYVYTGVGRFPQQNWIAATAYWPATSTTLAGILNCSVFANGANTNYNELYIHGFTGATSADVNGSILINGAVTSVPKGALFTNLPTSNAVIVWDTTATLTNGLGGVFFQAVQTNDDRWFYDNNSIMVEFTPVVGMFAIGVCSVGSQDANALPGMTAATLWSSAKRLVDTKQVPATLAAGAIGGWEQVWPTVTTAGGRAEYDQLYGLLNALIGNPATVGGSAALGKSIQFLTDFHTLDASMEVAYQSLLPNDQNVLNSSLGLNTLRVDPTSQDWDNLLAACRYAVSRLELPVQAVLDLATFPFVSDGLPASPALAGFVSPDARAVPAARGSRTKAGLISLLAGYQATGNVLNAALQNRYLIKGLLQGSGSGNSFNSTVTTTSQVAFNANAASFSGTVVHGLNFNFTTLELSMQEFFYSGAAVQVLMTHTPSGSPTAADTLLKAVTDGFGRIRVTADNTYVMTPSPTPTLALAPTGVGFLNFTSGGVTLATLTSGSATIVVRGILSALGTFNIELDITPGGATTGTFNVQWSYISDHELYGTVPAAVYPTPAAYVNGNATGSSLFV